MAALGMHMRAASGLAAFLATCALVSVGGAAGAPTGMQGPPCRLGNCRGAPLGQDAARGRRADADGGAGSGAGGATTTAKPKRTKRPS